MIGHARLIRYTGIISQNSTMCYPKPRFSSWAFVMESLHDRPTHLCYKIPWKKTAG